MDAPSILGIFILNCQTFIVCFFLYSVEQNDFHLVCFEIFSQVNIPELLYVFFEVPIVQFFKKSLVKVLSCWYKPLVI
jgi:hypothetical protein